MSKLNTAEPVANTFVFDATQANFEEKVILASQTTPVLVDLWAEWCGPCKSLGPVLEKLAAEYNGAFLLAKVDVDSEQGLAAAFGVRSIPMVVLIKDGQPLDAFTGALPEGQVREFLDRHVEKAAEAAAAETVVTETPVEAVARIRAEMAADPKDEAKVFDLAQALLRAGEIEEAKATLTGLPANLETDIRARHLRDQIALAESLAGAPPLDELRARLARNADDHEARDLLGVTLLMHGESEAGLETFIELLQRARDWNEGQARKRLVAAFGMLDDAALVGRYRRRMSSLLF